MNKQTVADTAIAIAMMIVALLGYSGSRSLPPPALEPIGPAAFPVWASGILFVLGFAVLAIAWFGPRRAPVAPVEYRQRYGAAFCMGGLTVLYVAAMDAELLGFRWATVLYAFGLTALLFDFRRDRLPVAAGIALLLGVGLHYLFTRVFYIDLP